MIVVVDQPHESMNEAASSAPASLLRRRLFWWGLILGSVLLFAYLFVTFALQWIQPAFTSIDEVDLSQIDHVEFFVLNRPDGSDDIGKVKVPIVVAAADVPRLLAPLRGAKQVPQLPSKTWLSKITLVFNDGHRQTIMLYWSRADLDKGGSLKLRYTIGNTGWNSHRYEAGLVEEFIKLAQSFAPPPPE
ncbi:MAG: hypothetical protein ACRCZF_19035 [Gemmataceae bacterium]